MPAGTHSAQRKSMATLSTNNRQYAHCLQLHPLCCLFRASGDLR